MAMQHVPELKNSTAYQGMRRNMWAALLVAFGFGGLVLTWASLTEIDSAIMASGLVAVESNVKKIQHSSGGVVAEILVTDGSRVNKGDVLVRLDQTNTKASLGIIQNEMLSATIKHLRLMAERDGLAAVTFPPAILAASKKSEALAQMLATEEKLLYSRHAMKNGQEDQLRQRIMQLKEEIKGIEKQKIATTTMRRVSISELEGLQNLLKKGLVEKTRVNALEREVASREGALGQLEASQAETESKITETELQILQLNKDSQTEVNQELRDVGTKIGELKERKTAAENDLKNTDIIAPLAGIITQLSIHTVGGVINATEPLMLLVPLADNLVIDVRLSPNDIDEIQLGLPVRVRFSSFNRRDTPETEGVFTKVSGDVLRDQQTGAVYYTGVITVPETELAKLSNLKLVPGMPAEVHIKTGKRTPLSYLLKPFSDQVKRTWLEN